MMTMSPPESAEHKKILFPPIRECMKAKRERKQKSRFLKAFHTLFELAVDNLYIKVPHTRLVTRRSHVFLYFSESHRYLYRNTSKYCISLWKLSTNRHSFRDTFCVYWGPTGGTWYIYILEMLVQYVENVHKKALTSPKSWTTFVDIGKLLYSIKYIVYYLCTPVYLLYRYTCIYYIY